MKNKQSNNQKKKAVFQQALTELTKETGIDYYKLITGDEKERQRLNFKHFQEKMLDETYDDSK